MFRLLTDENFNGPIIEGLLLREPALDLVRAVDVGLSGWKDPQLLEWSAAEGRILLTHDHRTMPDFAYDRMRAGVPMPGVIVVSTRWSPGPLINELMTVLFASEPDEYANRVAFIPL